jgi:hypothetical protein
MAYCTYTDITDEIGTALGTATQEIIERRILKSDEQIANALADKGITALPASDTRLRDASIFFTCAWIKRRQAHELSRPGSLSLGGDISFGTSPDAEASAFEAKAQAAIAQYVKYAGGSGVAIVRNHSMLRGY